MSAVFHHRRRHHPTPHPHPEAHPHLPPDAHIGTDERVRDILQSYQDQIPAGVQGHDSVVVGYATGPNPSEDGGFYVSGYPRPPHQLVYFWTAPNEDSPLNVGPFDYVIERINEGKTTYND
jgi:hypothetical protein